MGRSKTKQQLIAILMKNNNISVNKYMITNHGFDY
jgi:hypothetical protein